MARTMQEILESTRRLVATKQAEFKSNVKGAAGLETTGAGDDSPLTRGHALEADQAALEPTKKDLLSGDAKANPPADGSGTTGAAEGKNETNVTGRQNTLGSEDPAPATVTKKELITGEADAKKADDGAAKLANDILRSIRDYQGAKAAEVKQVEPKAAVKPVEKVAAPKDAAPQAPEKKAVPAKVAAGLQMELTSDVLQKIAAIVLSTEEGADFVEQQLAKVAGAEAARETLGYLAQQSELAEKQAAYEAGEKDAEALIAQSIYDNGIQEGIKRAEAVLAQHGVAPDVFTKLGQEMADASIGDLMQAGDMAGGAPEGMAPEGMAPDAGGGDEGISVEELAQALEGLVQEGTISPEEAQQVLEYVAASEGGGEGGAPEMGGEPEAAPAEPAEAPAEGGGEAEEEPAEKKEDEGDEKEGAARKAAALLDAIRKVRASK